MHAALFEDLDHEIRGAVEDLGMLLEAGVRVEEALELDHPSNAIEATELELDRRKDVERREARELVAVLARELAAEPALWRSGVSRQRTLARDEEQVSGSDAVRVVRGRIAGPRKPDSELLEPIVDRHRDRPEGPGF